MNFAAENIKKIWQPDVLPRFLFFFIAVWTAAVMFGNIRFGDLSGYDDAAYAHEAKVMIQSGDWWTMNLNGNPDFDKPPLFIWLVAVSFKIFGATDFAAKIPGVLFGLATVILVYFLTQELFLGAPEDFPQRVWLPVLAMLSMATTQYFLKYASHAMTDVPFAFFFALAVYFYVRALKNNFFLLLCGVSTGLATLIRSPMGLFPLAIVVLHLVFTRRFKLLFSFYFIACVTFALLLPGVWFFKEYNIFGDAFISRHFANILNHSASETQQSRTGWQQFLWYFEYLFLIVKLYFPWFPLMFYGLYRAVRKVCREFPRVENSSAETLLIVWFIVVLVPFSLVESKVLRYILPVFPAFAILAADALGEILSLKRLIKFLQVSVPLLTLAAIIILAFPNYLIRGEDMHVIAPVSDAATAPEEKVLLYTNGEYQWNYQTQLLWYGKRLCILIKDTREIENNLTAGKQTIVIMDKNSFAGFSKQTAIKINVLGESEHFVCFRAENQL